MSNEKRLYGMAVVFLAIMTVLFWQSIVFIAIGKIILSIIGAIVYTVSIIGFLHSSVFSKELKIKKKILLFLLCESIQLVPYLLILLIRVLVA